MDNKQDLRRQIDNLNRQLTLIGDRLSLCRNRDDMRKWMQAQAAYQAKRDELLRLHGPLPEAPKPAAPLAADSPLPTKGDTSTSASNDSYSLPSSTVPQERPTAARKPQERNKLPKWASVHPTIAKEGAAPSKKQASMLAAWYLLRAWDIENQQGRGKVDRQTARELLTGLGQWGHISWRRMRQVLGQGNGKAWDLSNGQIWLYAPWRVVKALDIGRLKNAPVRVKTSDLAAGVKRQRALFYTAAFNATRKASPITRTALQEITGVSPRTQQDYDKIAKTAVQRNIAVTPHKWGDGTAREKLSWIRGKSIFSFTDWTGKHAQKGTKWIAYGLPNSYECALEHAPRGRQKKHNSRLDRLVKHEQPGNDEKSIVRIYHQNGKKAGRAFDGDQEHDHYWYSGRTLQPTISKKAKLTGINVWNVLSMQGVDQSA